MKIVVNPISEFESIVLAVSIILTTLIFGILGVLHVRSKVSRIHKIVGIIILIVIFLPFSYLVGLILLGPIANLIPRNKSVSCFLLNENNCRVRSDCMLIPALSVKPHAPLCVHYQP